MGLLLRLLLAASFCAGVYALDARYPAAFERPEAVASVLALGLILLASLFETGPTRPARPRRRRRGAPLVQRNPRTVRHGDVSSPDPALDPAAAAFIDAAHDPAFGASSGTIPERISGTMPGAANRHASQTPSAGGAAQTARPPQPGGDRPAGRLRARLAADAQTARRRKRAALGGVALSAGAWLVAAVLAATAFSHQDSLRETALTALSGLRPGAPIALSAQTAVLTRERGGHFTTLVTINQQNVRMLVDTGSSDVALPFEDAERLGVPVERLTFSRPVMTANGQAMVAPVTLPEVQVGPITLQDVRASVAEPGRLGSALLGMSFLGQLSEVSIRGEKLILKE